MLNYSEDIYKPNERRKKSAQQGRRGKIIFLSILGAMVLINIIVLSMIFSQAKAQAEVEAATTTLWDSKDYSYLAKNAEKALQDDPNNFDYLVIYGYSLYRLMLEGASQDMYLSSAIDALQTAANMPEARGNHGLFSLLGKLYYMTGYSYEAALLWLNKALVLKREPESLLLQGLSYLAIGNTQDAIDSIEQYRLLTGNPMAELLKGKIALEKNDLASAESSFLMVSSTATNTEIEYLASLLLAEMKIEQKRYGEAQRILDTLLVGDGELAHEYYLRGLILEAYGKDMEARSMWRKAILMDPKHKPTIEKVL